MDRESILKKAKKIMLREGECSPMLFVLANEQSYILVIADKNWNTDNFGRVKVLFLMGREFAQSEYITPELVSSVSFVHEFWYVMRPIDEPLPDQPSACTDRQECLGLLELKINQSDRSVVQTFVRSEILRHGSIIDLGPCEEMRENQSNLLTSFLAGVASAKYNDEEFGKVIERYVDVGEI